MAKDIIDLTADIVIARVSVTEMSSNDLLKEIRAVYATLEALTAGGGAVSAAQSAAKGKKSAVRGVQGAAEPSKGSAEEEPLATAPAMTIEEAFKPDRVACMICGKGGMRTLKRHLASAHDLKPGQYRKRFGISKDQPLAATEYVEKRRRIALDRGLGEKLAAAREARKNRQMGE